MPLLFTPSRLQAHRVFVGASSRMRLFVRVDRHRHVVVAAALERVINEGARDRRWRTTLPILRRASHEAGDVVRLWEVVPQAVGAQYDVARSWEIARSHVGLDELETIADLERAEAPRKRM